MRTNTIPAIIPKWYKPTINWADPIIRKYLKSKAYKFEDLKQLHEFVSDKFKINRCKIYTILYFGKTEIKRIKKELL